MSVIDGMFIAHNMRFYDKFLKLLGPGQPSAGGPRMDRRVVTGPRVVKISRLASHLWRSAWRGPQPTEVLIKLT